MVCLVSGMMNFDIGYCVHLGIWEGVIGSICNSFRFKPAKNHGISEKHQLWAKHNQAVASLVKYVCLSIETHQL